MTVRRVMGTEVEYGVSLPGQPSANAMLLSAQVVNAYASTLTPAGRARRATWDFEEESPLRDARGFELGGRSAPVAQEFIDAEEDAGMANVILPERRAALRRPRPSRVLDARGHEPAGHRPLGQGRRADHGRRGAQAAAMPGHQRAHQPLQEQHRQQGRVLRLARELPDEPGDALRLDHPAPRAVLRLPAGRVRRRPGRHRAGRAPAPASRSRSAPTSSRSRSASRPP